MENVSIAIPTNPSQLNVTAKKFATAMKNACKKIQSSTLINAKSDTKLKKTLRLQRRRTLEWELRAFRT